MSLLALALALTASLQQADLRVLTMPEAVAFGAPFELVVERSWPAEAPPPPWDPHALAPLRVETVARALRELPASAQLPARVVERRTLRATAFELGAPRVGDRSLTVLGALDPAAPGDLEEPALPPPGLPFALLLARGGALLLLAAASVALARALRRGPVAVPAQPDGIGLLRAWADSPLLEDDGATLRAALDAALLQRTGVDARARSGAELLADPRVAAAAGAEGRAALGALRDALDAWHYAGRPPSAGGALAAQARVLADALAGGRPAQEAAA